MMKRRDFIKLGSALGAASTLEASRLNSFTNLTIMDTKETLTANRFGMFYVETKSGRISSVRPFEGDKNPSVQIEAFADMTQNNMRVEYPMVRKSYLKANGPANNDLRGKDEFVRVSWDVALDLTAKAMKENHEKYGSESIYGECYWWGGSGQVSWGRTVSRRMMTILGGYVSESGDYSTGAGLVIMPHVVGETAVYSKSTKWKTILEESKNVVVWGSDPINTNQSAWKTPDHRAYDDFGSLQKAVKDGKINVFSVDCKRNDTQRYLNSKFISVIPNTDVSMMIGMIHHLYTKKLYDAEFIKKYTVGFNKFKKYLLGTDDGIVKDINWASKICGVDAKVIAEFAEVLQKDRSIIIFGRAMQRADHGEQVHWTATVLSAMLGYIGLPGGGIEFSIPYGGDGAIEKKAPVLNGMSMAIDDKYNKKFPKGPWINGENIVIPSSRSIEALEFPGKMLDYNGKKIKLPHMRVMYNASSSFYTRHQNVNNMIKQWKKVDTIITAEPYWNFQAKMSDIVLPVAIGIERIDIDQSMSGNEFIIGRKIIVDPIGESQSDFWICKEICKRWGYEEVFTEGKTELEWAEQFYEDARAKAKKMDITMPVFKEFWEKGYFQFTEDDKSVENYVRWGDFRKNPHKNRLGTPSGKIEIYSPVIDKFGYDDCKGHPTWMEPTEWLGNMEQTKKHPLHMVSPHSRYRLHSQLNNSFLRSLAETGGREPMIIHPNDAKKRGLETGDIARVFNDRGEMLAGVYVTDTVRENVCMICEGAWYSPEVPGEPSLCQHGDVNVLTIDKGTSKLAQSNISHTTLVEVEKYKGVIKPLNAFTKPKIVQSL
jgi:trimethylamine-N-oxide reductase (cytochrome c)